MTVVVVMVAAVLFCFEIALCVCPRTWCVVLMFLRYVSVWTSRKRRQVDVVFCVVSFSLPKSWYEQQKVGRSSSSTGCRLHCILGVRLEERSCSLTMVVHAAWLSLQRQQHCRPQTDLQHLSAVPQLRPLFFFSRVCHPAMNRSLAQRFVKTSLRLEFT